MDRALHDALKSAVDAEPHNTALRTHFAEMLLASGDLEAALAQARHVASLDPGHAGAQKVIAAATDTESAARTAAPAPDDQGDGSSPDGDARTPLRVVDGGDDVDRDFDLGEIERPTVMLSDVGGLEEVKHRLNVSFLGPMRDPQLRELYGKSMRGGLLLYGPPGCGKTFVARATAGELGARFIAVGLSDILDMWLGNSEANLHQLFVTARRKAPCVVFLDEIDALGQKRSQLSRSAGRNVVVQLLSELDGMDSNDGVFVLGATNQPWDIDPALRRPGRFDRTLLVLPPDEPARASILKHHLQNRPTEHIDVPSLARATADYSGADLTHLCDSAAENALEEAIAAGDRRPVDMSHMKRALDEVKPSTRAWFEMARNAALFANQDGVYDDLIAYMRKHRLL